RKTQFAGLEDNRLKERLVIPAIALANKDAQKLSIFGAFHRLGAAVAQLREHMAKPDRQQAKQNRANDIHPTMEQFPVLQKFQRLKTERGKRGIAAADSNHEELPSSRTHKKPAAWIGEGAEEADDQ